MIGSVVAAPDGRLWVGEYQPIPPLAAQRWTALEGGRVVAALEMPPGVQLLDVRGDLAAGMWFDHLGVEHVGIFRIERRGGAPSGGPDQGG